MVSSSTCLAFLLLCYCANLARGAAGNTLEETESWRVSVFFLIFMILSWLAEYGFHLGEHYLKHKGHKGFLGAVHKIKEELMLMGFISLVLLSLEENIVKICVPKTDSPDGIPCCNSEGYTPAKNSPLVDVCPAEGQEKIKLISDKHDFECPHTPEGVATAPFLDVSALHQLHQLIFIIAVTHVAYSAAAMMISQFVVKKWTRWETFGDENEQVANLKLPQKHRNSCVGCLCHFFSQFKGIDPLAYIVLRRYHIVKHKLDPTFDFNEEILENHQKDFKELVGISSLMWLLIIVTMAVEVYFPDPEGYGFVFKLPYTFISLALIVVLDTKLVLVYKQMYFDILGRLREIIGKHLFVGGRVTEDDVEILQDMEVTPSETFKHIQPTFWFQGKTICGNEPKTLLLQGIRFVMFINSVVLAQTIFYLSAIQPLEKSCYYLSRGWPIIAVQCVCAVIMFLILSMVMIPRYSICAITARQPKPTIDNILHTLENQIVELEINAARSVSAARNASMAHIRAQQVPDVQLRQGQVVELCEQIFKRAHGSTDSISAPQLMAQLQQSLSVRALRSDPDTKEDFPPAPPPSPHGPPPPFPPVPTRLRQNVMQLQKSLAMVKLQLRPNIRRMHGGRRRRVGWKTGQRRRGSQPSQFVLKMRSKNKVRHEMSHGMLDSAASLCDYLGGNTQHNLLGNTQHNMSNTLDNLGNTQDNLDILGNSQHSNSTPAHHIVPLAGNIRQSVHPYSSMIDVMAPQKPQPSAAAATPLPSSSPSAAAAATAAATTPLPAAAPTPFPPPAAAAAAATIPLPPAGDDTKVENDATVEEQMSAEDPPADDDATVEDFPAVKAKPRTDTHLAESWNSSAAVQIPVETDEESQRDATSITKVLIKTWQSSIKTVKRPTVLLILIAVIFLLIVITLVTPEYWWPQYGFYVPHWTYEGWGGPRYWGYLDEKFEKSGNDLRLYDKNYEKQNGHAVHRFKKCSKGRAQSPINIHASFWSNRNGSRPMDYMKNDTDRPIKYVDGTDRIRLGDILVPEAEHFAPYFYDSKLPIFFCKNGTSGCGKLYWNETADADTAVTYHASHLIFHTPSEHTLDSIQFPMEMQVYHCNGECDHDSPWVVVSVLFDTQGDEAAADAPSVQALSNLWGTKVWDNGTIQDINFKVGKEWKQQKYAKKKQYEEMKGTKKKVDMSALYNLNAGFYHYSGSLTYPPCTEDNMQYLVQNIPMVVSPEQFTRFSKLIGYPGNARPTQPLNGRTVTYYSGPGQGPPFSVEVKGRQPSKPPQFSPSPPSWAKKVN